MKKDLSTETPGGEKENCSFCETNQAEHQRKTAVVAKGYNKLCLSAVILTYLHFLIKKILQWFVLKCFLSDKSF